MPLKRELGDAPGSRFFVFGRGLLFRKTLSGVLCGGEGYARVPAGARGVGVAGGICESFAVPA